MANERFPNDPFDPKPRDDDFGRASRLDNEVQPDPVLQEGRASTGRVALFAVAIALGMHEKQMRALLFQEMGRRKGEPPVPPEPPTPGR